MDRLIAAEVFLETVARGSISAAAVHLDMSRAMASRYIGEIEAWAGARLLHRTTRKLSLTAAGEALLPICKNLRTLSASVVSVQQNAEGLTGRLRISAPSILAEHVLMDALTDFLRNHPGMSVDLQIADRTVNLAEDGVDLAIRVSRAIDPNLIARKLGDCPSVICASPAYLRAHGTPAHVRDLTAHNCLSFSHFGRSIWHFTQSDDRVEVPITGNFHTDDSAIVVRAAIAGAGVAMLPWFAARQAVSTGALTVILNDFDVEQLGVHAVYLSRDRMPASMRAMIDHLVMAFDRNDRPTPPYS